MTQRTNDLVAELSCQRLLIIGDTILDIYVYGTAIGKSAETPTIVARELETKYSLGGAFLVARNALELGAAVDFITLVGADDEAALVRQFSHPRLRAWAIDDVSRRTTVKKRFWVDGYKLLQFDTLDNRTIDDEVQQRVLAVVDACLPQCSALLMADNRHGLMSEELIKDVVRRARAVNKPVYVDSQVSQSKSNHLLYRGATVICLNLKEALAIDPNFQVMADMSGFAVLRDTLGIDNVVVKLGDQGSVALICGHVLRTPAIAAKAVDACGAGDAFLAALASSSTYKPELALAIANTWAGLSTEIYGTEPPDLKRLVEHISTA